jgi:LL-diaminopimelate aminotransferase
MRPSKRLDQIPPYMFAQLERKIAAKRAEGVDVISLGIGDPDTPTYAPIVSAAQRAVADPSTHTYPSNRGLDAFRVLRAVLRGRSGPRARGDAGDRRQGMHLQPQPGLS